jgi:curved DNA-binding protein
VTDYYSVLGVPRTATDEDIKRAYRRLASQHHPDKGGDKERFQEIQQAYSVLSDVTQRQQYDNPGIRINTSGPQFNFHDIFDMFGARFQQDPRANRAPTVRVQLWISLQDVALGGTRVIGLNGLQGDATVEIKLPQGLEDGDAIRYPGLAPNHADLVAIFRIKPDPAWARNGNDVITERKVSIWDLILGSSLVVDTLSGRSVEIRIPAGTQPGTMLKIKNHGLPKKNSSVQGDLIVTVQAQLPEQISETLLEHIRQEQSR